MALTGFDPDVVCTSMNSVINAAHEVLDVLCSKFQAQFVDRMAELWACSNAQNFFLNSVKPAMDNLTNDANNVFISVVDAMRDAGNNWAAETGASFSAPSFVSNRKTLDVSSIQENINGVRGIDLAAATIVSNALSVLNAAAETALGNAVSAVQSCGFIGGTSAANLLASLNAIKTNINSTFSTCSASLKNAITETATSYKDTEGRIAQAFAGQE